jgi:hypothetical protein
LAKLPTRLRGVPSEEYAVQDFAVHKAGDHVIRFLGKSRESADYESAKRWLIRGEPLAKGLATLVTAAANAFQDGWPGIRNHIYASAMYYAASRTNHRQGSRNHVVIVPARPAGGSACRNSDVFRWFRRPAAFFLSTGG